ncbi:TetR/AcrR family transcriptional regulator [Microbacterium sp. SD291]|uniref:TetR/AcrR family transcriptional regulator n=1 Tax=Microbacterium sp. SD291 TaxID=2782007 RepID=UPI001A957DC2|nr:TetR/AcrR family transcriptional regulator [Microbacterium sp. SD291]MBO0980719.1 TetR/AcrR family transcriptional regulator [Microbacterium sp. SD291]
MARSEEQNRVARERARESILASAVELFSERGVAGASIAEITHRAGVSQGLLNYHFGSKEHLIAAVIDRWFDTLLGLPQVEGTADERLAGVIDAAVLATGFALPLQRAIVAMQQQPDTHRIFAESEARHGEAVITAENTVRAMFAERGAARPDLEEIMLRTTLEGIVVKYGVYGDTFPLEAARRWAYRIFELPEPSEPLPLAPGPAGEIRLRALAAVRDLPRA